MGRKSSLARGTASFIVLTSSLKVRHISLLDELYDQLIRERDKAVSEVHGASPQAPRHGVGSAHSSPGN